MIFAAKDILVKNGGLKDSEINLFYVALAFSSFSHEGIVVEKYIHHIDKLISSCKSRHSEFIKAGADDNSATQLATLKQTLHDQEQYIGDIETYDDLQNADIMRVIDRRKGMPIALSILYIHVGKSCGWNIEGLNFPSHFLCRIQKGTQLIIFDPFGACRVMGAVELRQLIKKFRGDTAELLADYYKPCLNREILFRLQNNLKLRMIEGEDYDGALKCVEMMRLLDENEHRLCLDAGVLYIKTGRLKDARTILERYKDLTPNALDRLEAQRIINEISFLE